MFSQVEDIRVLKFKRSSSAKVNKENLKVNKRSKSGENKPPKIVLKKRDFPY